MEIKYSELLKLNKSLKEHNTSATYPIAILSNIIVSQLSPILEYPLQSVGINANVSNGNFDNIIQDSAQFNKSNCIIIFWELCNIIDGFQYRSNILSREETEAILTRIKSEIDYTLNNLEKTPVVILNYFNTTVFNHQLISRNNFDEICVELNRYLDSQKKQNIVLFDLDKIFSSISVASCVDFRNYYSSKALYTLDFFEAYSKSVFHIISSVLGKSKKALIFDCDNTLWRGILGEDGESGIDMSGKSPKGVFFEEIQFLAKELAARGIIIGLNSKNNYDDVAKVISEHDSMSLSDSEIVIQKVNWNDKVSNLKAIAKELNIGLDSLVFVDDSDFEVNLIKEYVPEVVTVQVPKNLYEYPSKLRAVLNLFYSMLNTKDDSARVQSYKAQAVREESKSNYDSIDDYLKSLDLELIIHQDDNQFVERMAQLTQKTNQFNLTTKRYTFTDVHEYVNSPKYITMAFEVSDKFGQFGITGQSFIELAQSTANIDTFLMSCRVLGRSIEFKFLNEIIARLKDIGIKEVQATYLKTLKNQQVEDFYERAGFKLIDDLTDSKKYLLNIDEYKKTEINYIKVKYEK